MTMQQMRNIMYVFAVFLQISTFYVRKSGYFLDHEKNEEHNHTNDTTEIKTFSCEENIPVSYTHLTLPTTSRV